MFKLWLRKQWNKQTGLHILSSEEQTVLLCRLAPSLSLCLQHPAETLLISFLIKLEGSGGGVNTEPSMLNCLFSPLYISKNLPHIGTVIIT